MNEVYIYQGQKYNVHPDRLNEFLQKFPGATKAASDQIELDIPGGKTKDLSNWQNMKNNLYNAFEMTKDVGEFYFSDEGANSGLDIASTILYESVFGRERMKDWQQTDFGKWFFTGYESSDSEGFQNVIKNFEKEQKDRRQTKTFAEAETPSDYLSVVAGAITNVGGSVAYNLGTFGSGFFMEFAADNFITANEEKAKAENTTLENLLKSGNADTSAPLKIAAAQASLEYIGFSKILKPLKGTKVSKTYNKAVGNYLTKSYKNNKNIRVGLDIIASGGTEAFTEMGQTGLEIYNKELAVAKGKKEEINPYMSVFKGMLSPEGIEAGLQGFFGGGGLKGTGYSAKALNNIRKSNKDLDVEEDLNKLVDLTKRKNSTKDEGLLTIFENQINDLQKSIKNKIKNGNDLYNKLSNNDIKTIESLNDLADVTAFRANNLIEKFKQGEILETDFKAAIDGLSNKYKENKQGIQDVINKAKAKEVTAAVRKQVGKIAEEKGVEGTVTEGSAQEISDMQGEKIARLTAERDSNQDVLNDPNSTAQDKKIAEENIINLNQQIENQQNADLAFGYIDEKIDDQGNLTGDFEIVINKDKPMVGTAAHEFMHMVLFKTLKGNKKLQDSIGNALVDFINKVKGGAGDAFINRMGAYIDAKKDKDGNVIKDKDGNTQYEKVSEFGEETVTVLSESLLDGSQKYNESLMTKLGDIIRQTLQRYGFKEIRFDTGRDVYNFIKDFNKSIEKGYVSEAITKAAVKGVKGKLVEGEQDVKADPKTVMSKEASDNVQRIYEDRGEAGAFDIIEQFKPIVNKIVDKRRDAPNFDRELLTSEIEIGKRGILDLIKEYKPDSGVPLAAYINKFLPARAIEASKRILGEEFTQDVTERVDIAAEEVTTPTVKRKPRKIVLADRLGVTEKVSRAIEKIVPSLDINKLTFKTLKNKIPKTTGELFGIAPKKIENLANLTKKELQSAQMFISKNADLLIAMLPEGATASGTATGVPNTLLKAFYTKTERAKAAKTGSKAGLAIQQKNNIKKTDFLETFGIIDGKPDRTDRNTSARVLALANLTGKMITNQAVRAELAKTKANDKAINKIAEGKSNVMFSNDTKDFNIDGTIDNLLGIHREKVGRKTFKLRTKEDIDLYIQALINDVLPLMPRDFWFGTPNKDGVFGSEFTPSDRVIDIPDTRKKEKKEIYEYYKANILALRDLSDDFFGKDIGVKDFSRPSYKSLFEGKKGIQVDKIKATNKRTARIHEALWSRIYDAIQKNPSKAATIGNYFKLVSKQNNHWHRAAAEIIGYSKNPKGIAKKLYEYEHAMPASASYLYLIDGALKGYNFESIYKPVMNNFKLIALDAADNKKLTAAGLANRMPEGWNTTDNKWWERYFNDLVNIDPNSIVDLSGKTFKVKFSMPNFKANIKANTTLSNAIGIARTTKYSKEAKGITILDFDDTLATTKSLVKFTRPDGTTGTLNAEEYASTYEDLLDQGFTFDFSDFNKVVKGKLAPLFNKAMKLQGKFGPENMFVLTARPPQSQKAIFDFLKANGLNIPLKNITGLGNSTSEAKALWVANKVGEGYNDFYFADDALQNVQAVKNMLDQFDVKSKVQQAKVKFSKDMSTNFNDILQEVTGIKSEKRYSEAKARKRGEGKGKFRIFVPPSHEDLLGLLYNFMGSGRQGNKHREFFEKALIQPLNKAYTELNAAKQAIANDYRALIKQFPKIREKLSQKTPDGDYYYSDAIRVYLWDKSGFEIPGMSQADVKELTDLVNEDVNLQSFAEALSVISKQKEGYVQPNEHWETGDIRTDLADATGRVGRKQFFAEFIENADIIFSQENLNKIEAAYGVDFREALEDILYRTKNGTNRTTGKNKIVNKFLDYLNGSIGATMFFNARSAVLQTLSTVNFINFGDNNIFKAAAAFANQSQFWQDFSMIFNSDMLRQRRAGTAFDVNAAELSSAISKSKEPVRAAIRHLLQIGFLPTQIADSFAIALGGASMYRNRVKTYLKQGFSKKEAQEKAFNDFQEVAEATQQSARPDKISQEQASPLGRMILAFQNTPSQYVRLMKKAGLDLINRRKTPPYKNQANSDMSNVSKIIYYGAIQNFIFYGLQSALFAMMFEDDDQDEEFFKKKKDRVLNGSLDTILRGMGVSGAIISTIKNTAIKWHEQQGKGWGKEDNALMMEMLQLSPPIGIKARKLSSAEKTYEYNKKVINEMETFDIDNPIWSAVGNTVEATTNIPLARLHRKTMNLREAMNRENEWWQRLALSMGWSQWDVGVKNKEVEKTKKVIKDRKKKSKKKKSKHKTPILY